MVKETNAELEGKVLERKDNVSIYCKVSISLSPSKESILQNQDVFFVFDL